MKRRTTSKIFGVAFAGLAMFALALLVLQPVCYAEGVSDDSPPCCASMLEPSPPALVAAAFLPLEWQAAVAIVQVPASPLFAIHAVAMAPPDSLLACPRYYSRSVRNLN